MLLVVFKSMKRDQKITIPPMLLPINHQMLEKPCANLLAPVHNYFQQYLSPFVNKNHLKLTINSIDPVENQYPLYMYYDFSNHINECICSLGKIEKKQYHQNPIRRNHLIIRFIVPNQYSKQAMYDKRVLFINKQQLDKVDNKISNSDEVIIRNKKIKLKQGIYWSNFLKEKWQRYQDKEYTCIFMRVEKISSEEKQ